MSPPIPREWNYSVITLGTGQSSIVVPAPLSINFPLPSSLGHKLLLVEYNLYQAVSGGVGVYNTFIDIIDGNGPTTLKTWPVTIDLAFPGEVNAALAVAIPVTNGFSLTVQFRTASPGTVGQAISITGYTA